MHYLGFVRKDFCTKVHESISATIYDHWDSTESLSGPKHRPRDDDGRAPLGLKLLAVNSSGQVVWPESILASFPPNTAERAVIEQRKLAFLQLCPEVPAQQTQASPASSAQATQGPARTLGSVDFTIENGALPIDPTRVVDLPGVPSSDFTADRPGPTIQLHWISPFPNH